MPSDVFGGPLQNCREIVSRDSGARHERRFPRAWAEGGNADPFWPEFEMERFAEQKYIGLGRMIDGHAGSREKAGNRTDVKDAALMTSQAIDPKQTQIGQHSNV